MLISLDIDEPPETGWSVMPGFDQDIPIPLEHEPPRLDADETLPNMLHPSYPYGRPATLGRGSGRAGRGGRGGPGNLLGTVGGSQLDNGVRGDWRGEEQWGELALGDFVEASAKKEVPPGMAVCPLAP